jgi:hypothetical protein
VPTSGVVGRVVGVEQAAVLVLGVLRQVAVRLIVICTLVPIRRARVKMLMPAARLQVAKVWRMS